MVELVLPLAHPSAQPKWQIQWFSHFCTAHSRVSSDMPGHVLSLNKCHFPWGSLPHLIHASLGPPESITQTASRSVQPFLDSSCQCRRAYWDMPFPLKIANSHGGSVPPFNRWFLMYTRLSNPHGILIGSAGLHSSRHKVPVLYNELSFPPKLPLPIGIWTPSNT